MMGQTIDEFVEKFNEMVEYRNIYIYMLEYILEKILNSTCTDILRKFLLILGEYTISKTENNNNNNFLKNIYLVRTRKHH
jgi:hypothetical protein